MNLKELRTCPMKAYWSSLGLAASKANARFSLRDAMRSVLDNNGLKGFANRANLRETLESLVPEDLFAMKTERNENLRLFVDRLHRMYLILNTNGFEYKGAGRRYHLLENGKELSGFYDMVLVNNGKEYAVKITNKSEFSANPKTKSWIGNDPDMLVLYKATGLIPAVFALQGNETGNAEVEFLSDEDIINPKKWVGKFWNSVDFSVEDSTTAEEALEELTNIPVSKNSAKNEKECGMCYFRSLCQYEDTDNDEAEILESEKVFRIPEWTDTQKEIINHTSGEMRVLAGAGSGKTATLTGRLKELALKGADPERILAVTFTEKAVAEMQERLERYLMDTDLSADSFKITTFNSLGYEIVQENWARLGYTAEPVLIDDSDKVRIVASVMDKHEIIPGLNYANPFMKMFKAEGAVHQMIRILNAIKRKDTRTDLNGDDVKALLEGEFTTEYDFVWDEIAQIYNEVSAVEKESNLLEYDDQIHLAVKLFKENPDVAALYADRYDHITIDEFQDTGLDQMDMIKFLYSHGSLLVCGDDSQSIYGFRGVSNKNIVEFDREYPNCRTIEMVENFRSTQQILDCANQLIERNGATKKLIGMVEGQPVKVLDAKNRDEGNAAAVEQVLSWIDNDVPMKDIAILARTRSEILDIRRRLKEVRIPNVISVSEYLRDDNQMIGTIALAAWIMDMTNIRDLAVWLRHSNRAAFDSQLDLPTYLALQSQELQEQFDNKDDAAKYEEFRHMIEKAYGWRPSNSLKTWLALEDEEEPSMTRAADFLKRLKESNSSLSARADEVVYDAVTLSTIHAAKGREWKYVVVCANGLTTDICTADIAGLCELKYDEEEIRTYFVAVTRARQELVITANAYWKAALGRQTILDMETLKDCGVKIDDPYKKERDKAKRRKK